MLLGGKNPRTWKNVVNNHGDRFRGTLRIGLFTTLSKWPKKRWLIKMGGDPITTY